MNESMQTNFDCLWKRVLDAVRETNLYRIRYKLREIKGPTIVSGVGGSSVVSEFASKVLNKKNGIATVNSEPRDFLYRDTSGYRNVLACSYSGNNYGVELAFKNNLKHYLLSNNSYDDKKTTYLQYITSIDKERSFISLGATLIPICILLDYYLERSNQRINNQQLIQSIYKGNYNFDIQADAYEIFSGFDTSTASKYLESTFVESGIAIPIVHDKYAFCHGRSTLSINNNNIAIYFNRGTELDKLLLEELKPYYKNIVVLTNNYKDSILADYDLLIQAMYLTKYMASKKSKDLSNVQYCPIVKKLYKYNGNL